MIYDDEEHILHLYVDFPLGEGSVVHTGSIFGAETRDLRQGVSGTGPRLLVAALRQVSKRLEGRIATPFLLSAATIATGNAMEGVAEERSCTLGYG